MARTINKISKFFIKAHNKWKMPLAFMSMFFVYPFIASEGGKPAFFGISILISHFIPVVALICVYTHFGIQVSQ